MREVAFTKVTKMRTTWRKSGTITAWKSCRTSKLATRAAASPTARLSGTAESRAIAMIRRVPNKYRRVRPVTTQTLRTASARPVRSPDQISEDRIEAIVRALEATDLQPGVGHDRRELAVEGIGLAGPDEQGVLFGNLQRDDMLHPGEGLRELSRLRRLEAHRVRMLVDQGADRVDVARRDGLAVVDEDDVVGDALDLVEHMGRHEDVTARLCEVRDRPEDQDPGERVGPGERLVEDQDLRSVGERLGELRTLAHPAAVGPGGTLRRARETDELQGVFRGFL